MTNLLLDMDGPLADTEAYILDRYLELGLDVPYVHASQNTHRFMADALPRHQRKAGMEVLNPPGAFAELPVTEGAQQGVRDLLEAGVNVWVCTKPLESNVTCLNDKHGWLVRHFPELSNYLITAPDKGLIKGDILLDDAIKLDWVARADWAPVVFPTGFNGEGSQWAHLPRWSWGDPIEDLLAHASGV